MWTLSVAVCLVVPCGRAQQFADLGKSHIPGRSSWADALALGDVDGDGDRDLVIGGSPNRLYLNDGHGRFRDVSLGQLPVSPDLTADLALGDVDGDGDLDLVLASGSIRSTHQNRLYLNDGKGKFADATGTHLPAILGNSQAVALGDVDGDGDPDLVFGNARSGSTRGQTFLYLNDGKGRYSDVTKSRMPIDGGDTHDVFLGDVDGDKDLDLVLANAGGNRLYLGDGKGSFKDASSGLPFWIGTALGGALGDVDGDGDLDLVFYYVGSRNRLLLGDGKGKFVDATATHLPLDADASWSAALGDLDGDGDLDLVFGNIPWYPLLRGQNRLYLNDGKGKFSDATTRLMPADSDRTQATALGDVDGDGDLDVVIGNWSSTPNRLYLNDGRGKLTDGTGDRLPHDRANMALAVGDVDLDGDPDLVFGRSAERNRLYLNDGKALFSDASAARLPGKVALTHAVVLGDVDGDGDPDLIVGNRPVRTISGQNRLLLNDGKGSFSDATSTSMPLDLDDTRALALGDVDGDRDLDLVLGTSGAWNRLYLGDGKGRFSDATRGRMPPDRDDTRAVALHDVDRDGDLDLILGNRRQQNRLYLNDGKGSFSDVTAKRMPSDLDVTSSVALGDVDGDGDADILWGNDRRTLNRLYLNDGKGTFRDVTATRMPPVRDSTAGVALGDLDGDGDLDLVVANGSWTDERNRLLLNDGKGSFADSKSRLPAISDFSMAVALSDVDGDQDLDLVLANDDVHPRLYLNLQRQVHAPYLAVAGRPYELRFSAMPGFAPNGQMLVPFLSFSQTSPPIVIPPLGRLRLGLTGLLTLPPLSIVRCRDNGCSLCLGSPGF